MPSRSVSSTIYIVLVYGRNSILVAEVRITFTFQNDTVTEWIVWGGANDVCTVGSSRGETASKVAWWGGVESGGSPTGESALTGRPYQADS